MTATAEAPAAFEDDSIFDAKNYRLPGVPTLAGYKAVLSVEAAEIA